MNIANISFSGQYNVCKFINFCVMNIAHFFLSLSQIALWFDSDFFDHLWSYLKRWLNLYNVHEVNWNFIKENLRNCVFVRDSLRMCCCVFGFFLNKKLLTVYIANLRFVENCYGILVHTTRPRIFILPSLVRCLKFCFFSIIWSSVLKQNYIKAFSGLRFFFS